MLLLRISLFFFFFSNINLLFSIDDKLINIRLSDNHQSKSLRIVLDLTHKAPYTVFSLKNNPRLVIDLESKSEIKEFKNKTTVGMLVNTSFNVRGEPIVNSPTDAYKCFMGTELDYLVIGNCILDKNKQNSKIKKDYKNEFELD